jgi:hypothetical protein
MQHGEVDRALDIAAEPALGKQTSEHVAAAGLRP